MVTIDSILKWLHDSVEEKHIIDAHTWVDAAQKLNVLLPPEHDKLFTLQQSVAASKVAYMEEGHSTVKANILVEASDIYKSMQIQKARIENIEEMIRIAKLQARLKDNEYRG